MFQVGASVQADAAAAAEAGTLQQRGPGNDVSRKCNSENRPGFIPPFSDSQGGKILVRLEPGGIRRQALCASRVIQRNHLVHYGVQRVALAISLISMGSRSPDLRDRQIVTSPHDNSAGMERAIKPQNNFGGNIAEAKSKLRCEHHRLSHRRIGKSFFSAPAHDQQFNPGQSLLAITIWKSSEEASNCGRFPNFGRHGRPRLRRR